MKTARFILLTMTILTFSALTAPATIFIYDGEVHNYYSSKTFTESVYIDMEWPGTSDKGVPGVATVVNIYGATFQQHLRGWEDSKINLYYGNISYLDVHDRATLTVHGGYIGSLVAAAYTEISNGDIGSLKVGGNGVVANVTGGSFPDLVSCYNAVVFVYGTGFKIDGNPAPYGEYLSLTGQIYEYEPIRHITGTLANGEPLDAVFSIGDSAKIILIPEPLTIISLVFGVCLLKRK